MIKLSTYVLILAALTLAAFGVKAQGATDPAKKKAKLYYKSEYVFGAFLHTQGYGGYFRYMQNLTGSSQLVYGFELSNMRHPKQQKIFNPYFEEAKGYFYGKLNSLTITRFNMGNQKVIFGKELDKGVKISYIYQGGVTLGWVAPVYLEVSEGPGIGGGSINTERYDPLKHNLNNIYGRASFVHGLEHLGITPGAHLKLAMNFEYSPEDESVKALELGFTADAFAKEIPIMAATENYQFWYTFYLSIHLGKKIY